MRPRLACLLLFLSAGFAQQHPATSAAPSPQGFRIAGMIVSSVTGQPVALASVAIAPVSQTGPREVLKSVTTAEDGRFSFAGLARGKYSLMAAAHGFRLQYFEHHDPYASAVAVGPDLDAEHLMFRLDPDAFLEGEISDENNDPVQNALVRLFESTTEEGQQKTTPVNQAQSDDQGHYHIGHLAPGKYYLAVSARPWYAVSRTANQQRNFPNPNAQARSEQDEALLDVTYPITFYPDSPDSAGAGVITLNPGERTSADVVLHAVPALHLRIRTGDSGSGGIGGMVFPRVMQRMFDGYLDSVFNAPASAAGPGMVEISGLAPGRYIVEVPTSSSPNQKGSSRGWYREIDVTGDTEVNASEGPAFVSVTGSVVFEGFARPPKNVSIRLMNPDTGESFRSSISEKGEFDFSSDDIRPGRYLLALESSQGYFFTRIAATGARLTGRVIDIGGGSSVRIVAAVSRGPARVDGTAMRDGKPFAGAMVVLVPHDPANNLPLFRRDQSDSDGTFTLPNVVPGQYTVVAIGNGWNLEWANPAVLQAFLKAGEAVQVPVDGKLQVTVQVQ